MREFKAAASGESTAFSLANHQYLTQYQLDGGLLLRFVSEQDKNSHQLLYQDFL